jgi:hypothetical protein
MMVERGVPLALPVREPGTGRASGTNAALAKPVAPKSHLEIEPFAAIYDNGFHSMP